MSAWNVSGSVQLNALLDEYSLDLPLPHSTFTMDIPSGHADLMSLGRYLAQGSTRGSIAHSAFSHTTTSVHLQYSTRVSPCRISTMISSKADHHLYSLLLKHIAYLHPKPLLVCRCPSFITDGQISFSQQGFTADIPLSPFYPSCDAHLFLLGELSR
ncbi:hypothetical protein ARMSODRAFT_386342 [Armillaria solidipes]|uniref:Uncharacterized protein n=1 Tax=Armillaria solidipes TaxID=1076256 RepID=A0A2H3BWU9_9AGAR|nr:hypothetical protein ARMSODRAFT_386342 [Armillaria solidipes]